MVRSLVKLVMLIAAGALATPAVASNARITIDGYDYVLPAPKGYCTDGPAVDAFYARMRARTIKPGQSGLAAMLTPCGADTLASDFYIVMVSGQPPTTRESYLTLMRRTMPVTLTVEQASDPAQMGVRLSDALRDRTSLGTKVHPIGVDRTCALSVTPYSKVTTGTIAYTMVACSSVIQKRIVHIFRYVPGSDFARVNAALLDMSRLLESIRSDATT